FTVSDASKGVIANDTNVFGVQLDAATPVVNGTVALNANGTFTFTPSGAATSGSFRYCANGGTSACAMVNLGPLALGGINCTASLLPANTATYLAVKTPGVLASCNDSKGYPLTVDTSTPPTFDGTSVVMDVNGGFAASVGTAGTYHLSFTVKNSAG